MLTTTRTGMQKENRNKKKLAIILVSMPLCTWGKGDKGEREKFVKSNVKKPKRAGQTHKSEEKNYPGFQSRGSDKKKESAHKIVFQILTTMLMSPRATTRKENLAPKSPMKCSPKSKERPQLTKRRGGSPAGMHSEPLRSEEFKAAHPGGKE